MKSRPIGVLMGLSGNVALAWGLYHLMEIGSCGDVGMPPCPADAWPYFVAVPVGIVVSVIAIFLGGGAFVFGGVFLAVGLGSLGAGLFGDNDETRTFATIFGVGFTFFGLLPLAGAVVAAPLRRRRVARAERLVASGGRGIGTVTAVEDTNVTINGNPRVRLRMRVEPVDGSAPLEREKTMVAPRVAIPRRGDRFPVFYDRDDPKHWAFATEMDERAPADVRHLFDLATRPDGDVAFNPPAAGAPAAGAAPARSPLDEIARLNQLRLEGAVSDEEFQVAKDRLLAQLGGGAPSPPA